MEVKKVVLCGSTRFKKEFLEVAVTVTKEGKEVLMPNEFEHADGIILSAREREAIDVEHLKKIDASDIVFIIDVGMYVGESTKKEIDYAEKIGKPIFFFSRNFMGGRNGN